MIQIRPVEAADLEAIYAISLATGLAGGDASHLHDDPTLIGHLYSAPYAVLEPDLGLVVGDEEGVGGYAVGALDTGAWDERLERDWWPDLRRRYADPPGRPSRAWTADQWRCFAIHHPGRTPAEITRDFPAHMHMNLLPRLQRQGLGAKLLAAWLELAAGRGAAGVHVGVNRANTGGEAFWRSQGFTELAIDPAIGGRSLWLGRRLT